MPLTTVQSGMMDSVAQYYTFKNRLINGAMVIDQRNNGSSVTITNTAAVTYVVDRWAAYGSQASKISAQRNAGSVTPPTGFINYFGITSLAATSVGASDYFLVTQRIEGFNVTDFAWGTVNATPITISFWVRSSITGTHSGSLQNQTNNRCYVYTYTISAANTWEYKTVTIAGDTTGTWTTDNANGIGLNFNLGSGSSLSTTAGSWVAGAFVGATGAVSVVGTNGATFYITGVQLEKGVTATSFDYRPYTTELQLCQRYTWKWSPGGAYNMIGTGYASATTSVFVPIRFPVTMRSSPTFTNGGSWRVCSNSCLTVSAFTGSSSGVDSYFMACTVTGATAGYGYALGDNNDTTAYMLFSAEL